MDVPRLVRKLHAFTPHEGRQTACEVCWLHWSYHLRPAVQHDRRLMDAGGATKAVALGRFDKAGEVWRRLDRAAKHAWEYECWVARGLGLSGTRWPRAYATAYEERAGTAG